ncbi:hypothetical protein ACH495_19000 [Micromonospora sp. NPDC018662]|uniref:hypothetical protein n=1 Tax=Micromonospora sp. NPDC018662 TaxID=3364238 RepID=UPI0037BC676B
MSVDGSGYQRWATFLESWQSGAARDPHGLPHLAEDDYPADVWARIVRRVTEALDVRLASWADGLERDLASARDEFEVARALVQSRRGLAAIHTVAGHPGLPEPLPRQLRAAVDAQIHAAQRALEDGVEAARRAGVDDRQVQARLRTIRENALTVTAIPDPIHRAGRVATAPRQPRRRLIVDRPRDRSEE